MNPQLVFACKDGTTLIVEMLRDYVKDDAVVIYLGNDVGVGPEVILNFKELDVLIRFLQGCN